jgi:hypothetical protein
MLQNRRIGRQLSLDVALGLELCRLLLNASHRLPTPVCLLAEQNILGRACWKYWPIQKFGGLVDYSDTERLYEPPVVAAAPALKGQ